MFKEIMNNSEHFKISKTIVNNGEQTFNKLWNIFKINKKFKEIIATFSKTKTAIKYYETAKFTKVL